MNNQHGKIQRINPHLMALITFLSLVPLVYFVPPIISPFLPAIKWLNVAIEVGIIVLIMSYGVMPFVHARIHKKD